jgi:selenocysteine lyase/cysteine desulfurase
MAVLLHPNEALTEAEASFEARHPDYHATRRVDDLRATEYRRLDEQRHTYLDDTGGSLYAEAQLDYHHQLLRNHVLGNPHSGNPAAQAMTDLVEQARRHVLDFFGASAGEYVVVFTPHATGALRLVGEAFPFDEPGARYLLTVDNHNSVNGIREFARRRGAEVTYAPIAAPDLTIDSVRLDELLEHGGAGPRLFAFPAQSNFSGVQHDLRWIDEARRRGWDVLPDASAFVPTNRLDLSRWQPDFVALSFYKMFGYPTGCGALVARTRALEKLRRPWFAGGTITVSSVSAAGEPGDGYYLAPGSPGYEDGTVNYLSLAGVDFGLRWLESVGLDVIHTRVTDLTDYLLEQLQSIRHANGQPVVRLYGPPTRARRGATIALNFIDPAGVAWNCWHVEALANARNLSLRSGCHCNPGAREVALDIPKADMAVLFVDKAARTYEQYIDDIHDRLSGVVRVSLGIASNFADVHRFVEFARQFVDCPLPRD